MYRCHLHSNVNCIDSTIAETIATLKGRDLKCELHDSVGWIKQTVEINAIMTSITQYRSLTALH